MNDYEKIILNKIFDNKDTSLFDDESFQKMKSLMNNLAFRDLGDSSSLIGRVKHFIKRLIRKLTKFYVEPIATQQSEFNIETVKLLESLNSKIEEEKENNNRAIDVLVKRLNDLSNENEKLKKELLSLNKEKIGD